MVLIDKEYYYIDLEAIDEFVFKKHDDSITYDEEVMTGPKEAVIQKTVIKRNNDEKFHNVRYDMVKTMLDMTYNSGIESEDGNIKYTQDIEETSIGSKLIFNTLLVYGFVKNKLDKK